MLRKWEELPEVFRCDEVKPYYDILYSKRGSLLLKRGFDAVTASVLLLLLSPAFLLISATIKADSPGPVFFRQTRITQYGRSFRIFKFRTMVNDAEKLGSQVTVNNDSRITRVGSFIRGCRLDEIPQLMNIISGDMSFVGTRPEVVKYVERYSREMLATLLLPAGVTSEASISYKDEAELLENADDPDRVYVQEILPEKMKYNLESIKKFSFMSDMRTMLRTVSAVLKH